MKSKSCKKSEAAKIRRVLRAMREHVAEIAKNRPKYITDFFALWEDAVRDVDARAEELLQHQQIDFPKPVWDNLICPYGPIQTFRFSRLTDRLELEEEERFLAACAALDAAWQKFFSTVLVRHPDMQELVARLEAARHQAHDAIVPIYTGEARPMLTPEWATAFRTLEDGFDDFAKGVAE